MPTSEPASRHPDKLDRRICSNTTAKTPEAIYGLRLRSVPSAMETGDGHFVKLGNYAIQEHKANRQAYSIVQRRCSIAVDCGARRLVRSSKTENATLKDDAGSSFHNTIRRIHTTSIAHIAEVHLSHEGTHITDPKALRAHLAAYQLGSTNHCKNICSFAFLIHSPKNRTPNHTDLPSFKQARQALVGLTEP